MVDRDPEGSELPRSGRTNVIKQGLGELVPLPEGKELER
jgi:hypothetical protein